MGGREDERAGKRGSPPILSPRSAPRHRAWLEDVRRECSSGATLTGNVLSPSPPPEAALDAITGHVVSQLWVFTQS